MKKIFYEYINEIISNERQLVYEWCNDSSEITFKKNSHEGFDLIIKCDIDSIYIYTDIGYHNEYPLTKNLQTVLTEVTGLARDLLSKNMRIREYLSNNKPYRWDVESLVDNKWYSVDSTGLIFWNYLGKRSEKIYFNNILSEREIP